ncbi:MAG: low molecular weight protein-tyrosine-phosphatase [Ferrimonas sp.]
MKLATTQRVLLVCMGNICRSPTAEAIFRTRAQQQQLPIEFDSAGTIAHHQGERPDPRSMAAGERRGYSFDGILARQVTTADFEAFDLLLAADKQNYQDLRRLAPNAAAQDKIAMMLQWGEHNQSEVADPYYGGSTGFEQVLDLLENAADGFITAWRQQQPT